MVVLAVLEPEVPVTVTLAAPEAEPLAAVSVITCVPVTGPAAKAAVTPVGKPLAASETPPVKPPSSVTEMVSETLPP
jgi:hypothetical protein